MTLPDLLIIAGLAEVIVLSVAETRRTPPVRRQPPRWRPPRRLRIAGVAAAAVAEIVMAVLLVHRYPVQTAIYLQADVVFAVLAMTVRHQVARRARNRLEAGWRA